MRRVARYLVVMVCASAFLIGHTASPAAANSALGLASNAWLISDLGYSAYNAYNAAPAGTVTGPEAAAAATATRATTTGGGFTSGPSRNSKLGLVVNGIAVLGTMAAVWNPLGGDAPEIPSGPPAEEDHGPYTGGNSSLGWWSGGVSNLQDAGEYRNVAIVRANIQPNTAGGGYDRGAYVFIYNDLSGALVEQFGTTNVPGDLVMGMLRKNYPQTIVFYSSADGSRYSSASAPSSHKIGAAKIPALGQTYPQPQAPVSTSPETVPRYIDTTITCKSAGGGTQILTQSTGPFTFNPAEPTTLPDVPAMECPAGTWLDSGGRELRTDGSTTKVPIETYNAPSWVETQATRFPECFPVGTQACQLHVKIVGSSTGTERECTNWPAGADHPCYKWLLDPDRSTRFRCYFGGYLIGLRACRALKEAYSPSPTITPSDPIDPDNPDPDDPDVVDPDAPPVDPTPETTPDLNSDGCIPTGWEILNPFSMFKATGCALKWAFVPKVALSTRISQITGQITGVVPFSWLSGLASLSPMIPTSNCPDWTVTVGSFEENVVCDSSYTDAIRAARPVLTGFMVALAVWPLVRSTMYAAFPILKPSPGVLR